MNLVLRSKTKKEVAKNRLTLKQSIKSHICSIRHLRVDRQVKNSRLVWTDQQLVIFWFGLTFYSQKVAKKSVSRSNINFINR